MSIPFPSDAWIKAMMADLKTSAAYKQAAGKWEGDFFFIIDPREVAALVAAATGEERSLEELILAGERAWNLKRLYNLRLGWNPAGEKLPRLLLQPLPGGGQMGAVPDMEQLLSEYYAAAGWDRATGWPTPDTLTRLGLDF